MFDIEKKNDELTFLVEKVSFKRKALIALLGLSGVLGCVTGYMQNAEKTKTVPVETKSSNKMLLMSERTR